MCRELPKLGHADRAAGYHYHSCQNELPRTTLLMDLSTMPITEWLHMYGCYGVNLCDACEVIVLQWFAVPVC